MVPTPAVVDDNPAAPEEKQARKNTDSSLDGADGAEVLKPAAHDDTKKKQDKKKRSQPDADGAATKKRRTKNLPAAPSTVKNAAA
jgi:hypothetical protein